MFGSYNLAGISKEGLETTKESIDTYLNNLYKILDEINTNAVFSKAFTGEYKTALQDYVRRITEAAKEAVKELEVFKTGLDKVYSEYVAEDTEMSSEINNTQANLHAGVGGYEGSINMP